jgi:hypothetical protein
MKTAILAEGIAATGTATQTAVGLNATPFLAGRDVILDVVGAGLTGTPTILIEGSDDNVTFSTLATHTALYSKQYNIKAARYMRARQSVAGPAGTYSAYLNNGA